MDELTVPMRTHIARRKLLDEAFESGDFARYTKSLEIDNIDKLEKFAYKGTPKWKRFIKGL